MSAVLANHRMTDGRKMTAMMRRILKGLLPMCAVLAAAGPATAQEVQVTGPLAGAPAVRNMRQHRKGRFEISPTVAFTLLDQFQRTMLIGARVNYNITDWLAIGVWGAFGAVHITTGLTDKIQAENDTRFNPTQNKAFGAPTEAVGRRLTALNVGQKFSSQLGTLNWVIAPQITAVPFRGKISLFEKVFVDTDAYFFVGPAIVGLTERADCGGTTGIDCSQASKFKTGNFADTISSVNTKPTAGRVTVAPTFGLGLSFYTGRFTSFGLEWRALPYSWNQGGFDVRGSGTGNNFPDGKVDANDRQFQLNQMITLSFGIYLPTDLKVSELDQFLKGTNLVCLVNQERSAPREPLAARVPFAASGPFVVLSAETRPLSVR